MRDCSYLQKNSYTILVIFLSYIMPPKKTESTTTKTPTSTRARKTSTTTNTNSSTKKTPTKQASVNTRAKTNMSTTTASTQIEKNTHSIEKNKEEISHNTKMIHTLYGAIIILLMIIAGLAFYIGQMFGNTWSTQAPNTPTTAQTQDIEITIIDDQRCLDCLTDGIVGQLQNLPFLSQASFVEKDFSDPGVAEYLTQNQISYLPAVIFNTNLLYDGGQITPYLSALANGTYSLAIGAEFDPFVQRSENGFLMLENTALEEAKTAGYRKGNIDSEILWLEFSDLDCPACKALYTQNTDAELQETFGENVSKSLLHFPLDSIHPNARAKAEVLECVGEISGTNGFYSLVETNFSGNTTLESLIDAAEDLGFSRTDIENCMEEKRHTDKVQAHVDFGIEVFGVNSTPTNIILNTQTGEYQELRGAAQIESFEAVINRMLGK